MLFPMQCGLVLNSYCQRNANLPWLPNLTLTNCKCHWYKQKFLDQQHTVTEPNDFCLTSVEVAKALALFVLKINTIRQNEMHQQKGGFWIKIINFEKILNSIILLKYDETHIY